VAVVVEWGLDEWQWRSSGGGGGGGGEGSVCVFLASGYDWVTVSA
jgi:hypothetical protein